MPDEIQEVQQVVRRNYEAFSNKDLESALSCYGQTMVYGTRRKGSLDDPTLWRPAAFWSTHDELREWASEWFASDSFTFSATIKNFEHTEINENRAVVVVTDTVKSEEESWEDSRRIWYLAKLEGEWKLVGGTQI